MCAGSRSEVDPCRPPPSEALRLFEPGFSHAKFFPAQPAGGVPYLESLAGPLPGIHFCLTGGIDVATAPDFLALPNVACVGGSWLTLPNAVARVGPSDHPVVCRLGHDPPGVLKLQLAALRQEVPDHSQLTWFLIRLAFWCVCAICWRAWITLALVLYVGTLGVINLFPTTSDKNGKAHRW